MPYLHETLGFNTVNIEAMSMITSMTGDLCSAYDNSLPFEAFLTKNGLDPALKRNKLKRKLRHSIVPHVRLV